MRLLFNPLAINADGVTVGKHMDGALVFLDAAKPGKYTKEDIAEAIQGANTELLADRLRDFGDCSQRLEWHENDCHDHLINSYIGLADRARYRDEVLSDTSEPVFSNNIRRFIAGSLEQLERTDIADINARTLAFDDPWRHQPYDKNKDIIFRRRVIQVLDELPSYYRILAEADSKLSIICTTGLLAGMASYGAKGAAAQNEIRLFYNDFCGEDKHAAIITLQEELLHYFDKKVGASVAPEYQRATDALLADDTKMAGIEMLCSRAFDNKLSIRDYPESHRNSEVFVTYFIIRDYLCGPNGAMVAGGWSGKEANGNAGVPPEVNEKMVELFGPELHALCTQAEEAFKREANSIQADAERTRVRTL